MTWGRTSQHAHNGHKHHLWPWTTGMLPELSWFFKKMSSLDREREGKRKKNTRTHLYLYTRNFLSLVIIDFLLSLLSVFYFCLASVSGFPLVVSSPLILSSRFVFSLLFLISVLFPTFVKEPTVYIHQKRRSFIASNMQQRAIKYVYRCML